MATLPSHSIHDYAYSGTVAGDNDDYNPRTGQYIRRSGQRSFIRDMDDNFLSNSIAYIQDNYGNTPAVDAMRAEQARRVIKAQYNVVPPGLVHKINTGQSLYTSGKGQRGSSQITGLPDGMRELLKGNNRPMAITQQPTIQLFEVAILQDTTNDAGKITTELVLGPKTFLATDAERAKLAAVADLARTSESTTDNIRVWVRAFFPGGY